MAQQTEDRFPYITYGARCNSREVEALLRHLLRRTFAGEAPADGLPPTPLCIWGRHGIGKTQLVREVAAKLGARFAYIAPAQFEEMGDLLGMPRIVADEQGGEVSRFMPPDWVPAEEGPGILLIDDVNRADDRILRGIMQLLQNYELVSWRLPPRWHIILTANPDGGDYSVTPLDEAMLTRMLHVTMEFDLESWVRWAEGAGVDPRGIAFVLAYPEVINKRRTTPRTLVHFFREISPIRDLHEQLPLVQMLADACLDPEATAAFIAFLRQPPAALFAPEQILGTENFNALRDQLHQLIDQPTRRMDLLHLICSRLTAHLTTRQSPLKAGQLDNLRSFILLDLLPNDLRLAMVQELLQSGHPDLRLLSATPEIGKLLLEKM